MSIGKRFVKLIRSNLNSLLDKTADYEASRTVRLEELSDAEIEAEMSRRRARRTAPERAAESARDQPRDTSRDTSSRRATGGDSIEEEAWREVEEAMNDTTGRYRTAGRRPRRTSQRHEQQSRRRPAAGSSTNLARLYAQLECPPGSDLTTVRKHYRRLMRKYHPDLHSGDDDKQRLATELSQKLTQAYNELRRALQ
ncbi:MAG: J domain-containing protein [Myxococcales bacterium]|nr:J domain-containing protein [Myxococcales bacterium]